MIRAVAVALVCLLATSGPLCAQEWARKMFSETSHDFGNVARGAKVVHHFKFKNLYEETVHVVSVRSSCGCSIPSIGTPTVNKLETGEILVEFNTKSFLGHRSATITVTFDQPFAAEVQLQVQGTIRQDVVFTPGSAQFGSIEQGSASEQKINVSYAGREDWRLADVQSTFPHVEVEMNRVGQGNGRVSYELLVRLKPDAPVGYVNEELILVTSDSRAAPIRLALEGRIVAGVAVTPASLYLGDIPVGDQVKKQLFIRSRGPIKISDVTCENPNFTFKVDPKAENLYTVAVTFTAEKPGNIAETIRVLGEKGATLASVSVYGGVGAAEAEEEASEPPAERSARRRTERDTAPRDNRFDEEIEDEP